MMLFEKARKNGPTGAGFTILELMVVCTLMVILAALALPKFSTLNRSFEHLNAESYLLQDIKRAQAEAITQGCRGVFQILPDKSGYTYGCDYLPYSTVNPPTHDVVSMTRHLPAHMQIGIDGPVIFNSRGQTVDKDGVVTTTRIKLMDISKGRDTFATGTLLGTGVFSFD